MALTGKVVAVTGASAGIGRATARELARRGADVGLIARGEERLAAARAEVEGMGRRACVAPADVADAEQVEQAAARIEAELGPIDVWVNVAMTAVLAEVKDTTAEEFLRVTQVTYLDALQKQLKVMDSTAFSMCMDNRMPIIVFDLFKPHNLRRVVLGEKVGTLVTGS